MPTPDVPKVIDSRVCMCKPCPMTGGYYVGGGLHICWLHAYVVPGLLESIIASDGMFVALTPTA